MKTKRIFAVAITCMFGLSFAYAQETGNLPEEKVQEELKLLKQEVKENYSKFSIGIYGGIPITLGGDMVTFSDQKTYIGYMGALKLGYQFSPYLGMSLLGQYSQGQTGNKDAEKNYMILPNGKTDYSVPPAAEAVAFQSIKSDIKRISAGLQLNFNVAPLFCSSPNRKVAFIISPTVYYDNYMPELKNSDKKFNTEDLAVSSLGFGGDVDLRIKASRLLDISITAGGAWVQNNKFDGVDNTGSDLKYGFFGQAGIGLVFKVGTSSKTDHMLYAPTNSYLLKEARERIAERMEAERIAKEKAEAERLAKEKAEAERLAREKAEAERNSVKEVPAEVVVPSMPSIHFVRGSAWINVKQYADQLNKIVATLKEYSDKSFVIYGYCDHTGTERLNDKLSERRANALKAYLVKNGIEESRLSTKGMGEDPNLSGQAALSIEARRVEVK